MTSSGKVSLVGAGPGDPELITVRGVRALQAAELVLYDYLVNPRILQYFSPTAECICLGSHGRSSLWKPEKIHAAMIDGARAGRRVVRLKGGDPLIFGRAAAELDALAAAGVPFEVIPGITAGLAAASFSGLPVTDREISSAVALITGQEDPAKDDSLLDYQSLARFPGTLMVYMGVTTAGHWTQRLIAAGKDPDTPVALIRRCTWPNQEQILCTLAEVADCVTPYAKFPPPVIAIVGEVARSLGRWNWFTCLPLHGQTVLVTRSRHQATELNLMLSDLGAEVLEQPAIETTAPASWDAVDLAIEQLSKYTHVIFTSSNGVRFFMERLMTQHADVRCLAGVRLVCVGPATAATLAGWRLTADAVPSDTFRAESILSTIMASPTAAATPLPSTEPRCLWVRTNRGRETVAETLTTAGAQVDEVVAYESSDVTTLDPEIELRLSRGEIHWVTATSSAIAQSAVRLLGPYGQQVRWASLSPLTTAALQAAGVNVSAEAKTASMPALVDAIRLRAQEGR